jgi:predicted small lipoprotein YifL
MISERSLMKHVLRLTALAALLAFAGCGSPAKTPPAPELTDVVISATVTANDLLYANEESALPVPDASTISSITRGEPMKSEHMGRAPTGTTLYPVRLTFTENGEPKVQTFYFYFGDGGKWQAVAGPREKSR